MILGMWRSKINKLWSLLIVSIVIFAACTVGDVATPSKAESLGGTDGEPITYSGSSPTISTKQQTLRDTIEVDISLYVLVDDLKSPIAAISSHRSEGGLRDLLDGINEIWRQADIQFDAKFVGTVEVPAAVLRQIARGDMQAFFAENDDSFRIPQPSTINGFYVRSIGGPNGINPFRSRTFFVIDEPSVHDRRVSSHEIGHIFGLHHVLADSNRLLFSGTNGMTLTEEEAAVARYVAQGILDGVR